MAQVSSLVYFHSFSNLYKYKSYMILSPFIYFLFPAHDNINGRFYKNHSCV